MTIHVAVICRMSQREGSKGLRGFESKEIQKIRVDHGSKTWTHPPGFTRIFFVENRPKIALRVKFLTSVQLLKIASHPVYC